jgi:hypothetical protein
MRRNATTSTTTPTRAGKGENRDAVSGPVLAAAFTTWGSVHAPGSRDAGAYSR